MPGLGPGIHAIVYFIFSWMAGPSPAMTDYFTASILSSPPI
jgi:hypothetical protein